MEIRARGHRRLRERLRLYVVTAAGHVPGRGHLDVARDAVAGGATAIQLRAPELRERPEELAELASSIAALCRKAGALFVVNDAAEAAVAAGADGAHVGLGDRPQAAREVLGPERVLGVSVDSAEEARAAERLGADYLGVTVWSTATKPDARPQGLEGLAAVVAATALPVVGIGGIGPRNAPAVLAAGAAGVAVVSAVSAAADPRAATRELLEAIEASDREAHAR